MDSYSNPIKSTDPDPNMQIISDPAGPGIKSTTLVYTSQDEEGSREEKNGV